MRFSRRARLFAASSLTVVGLVGGAAVTAGSANAVGGGNQWCQSTSCANEWSNGPYVKTYNQSNNHNNFAFIGYGDGVHLELQYTGPGAYNGQCVGDAGNVSGNANVSLTPCGANGSGAPWGGLFIDTPCTGGGTEVHNTHWNGDLGPGGFSNGDSWYLNKPLHSVCLFSYPPG